MFNFGNINFELFDALYMSAGFFIGVFCMFFYVQKLKQQKDNMKKNQSVWMILTWK